MVCPTLSKRLNGSESERLSIELQAVKQENEALKAKISELEKKLETA